MRVAFVLRIIRQSINRALAGECGIKINELAAELAAMVRDEWTDPESGKRRPVPSMIRMRALRVAVDLHLDRGPRLIPGISLTQATREETPKRVRNRPTRRRAWF